VQEHIFDPFFTTKPPGKGTGLGMSMVFGFISRSKGHIKIYSEPKIGTTLNLYLPRAHEASEKPLQLNDQTENPAPHGQETILIVDDEEDLLEMAKEYLSALGYQTLTAINASQALEQLNKCAAIDLLFSDVVMPGGINGYELAEQATAKYPKLKVLLTSGFTSAAISKNGQARFNAHLLPKPYQIKELAKQVRARLDSE
jgi:CheY-like chemotaxis protein